MEKNADLSSATNTDAQSSRPASETPPTAAPATAPFPQAVGTAKWKSAKLTSLAATAQGFYFLVIGLWPVVSPKTFVAVTGPKTDYWLAISVGLLTACIGIPLLVAAFRRQIAIEFFLLAISSAAALAGVDVVCWVTRKVPVVYLLDFVAEVLLIALWTFSAKRERQKMRELSKMSDGADAAAL